MSMRTTKAKLCGLCKQPVRKHTGKGAGYREIVLQADGSSQVQLWHAKHCWPEELRQRRLREQELRRMVVSSDNVILDTMARAERSLRRELPRVWYQPPDANNSRHPTGMEGDMDAQEPIRDQQAESEGSGISKQGEGLIFDPGAIPEAVRSWVPIPYVRPKAPRTTERMVRQAVDRVSLQLLEDPSGAWFTTSDVWRLAQELVPDVKKASAGSFFTQWLRPRRAAVVQARWGLHVCYRRALVGEETLPEPTLPKSMTTTREKAPKKMTTPQRVLGRPVELEQPPSPPVLSQRMTTTNGRNSKIELLSLIDRSCADLHMMMSELIAGLKGELRKRVEESL